MGWSQFVRFQTKNTASVRKNELPWNRIRGTELACCHPQNLDIARQYAHVLRLSHPGYTLYITGLTEAVVNSKYEQKTEALYADVQQVADSPGGLSCSPWRTVKCFDPFGFSPYEYQTIHPPFRIVQVLFGSMLRDRQTCRDGMNGYKSSCCAYVCPHILLRGDMSYHSINPRPKIIGRCIYSSASISIIYAIKRVRVICIDISKLT